MVESAHPFMAFVFSPYLLLTIITISFVMKIYFLRIIVTRSEPLNYPWIFAIGILGGSMFGDFAWALKLARTIFFPSLSYAIVIFFIRISWGFVIIQYQSLALFMQSLIEKKLRLTYTQKIVLLISCAFSLYFFYLAFFEHSLTSEHEREFAKKLISNIPWERKMMRYTALYLVNLLVVPRLYKIFKAMRSHTLPKILRRKLSIFMRYLVCPYVLTEFLQTTYFSSIWIQQYVTPVVSFSTMLLIYAMYYCMRKVMCMDFGGTSNPVQPVAKIYSIDNLKSGLAQLSQAHNPQELVHIVQQFFNEAYQIPRHYSSLHIRQNASNFPCEETVQPSERESLVEQFLCANDKTTGVFIEQEKILVYDTVAFGNFYAKNNLQSSIESLLREIDTDIFLPIYIQHKMVAYILIKSGARGPVLYSSAEQDEMVIFASCLGNIINLLLNKNVDVLTKQTKNLQDKLHSKNQETALYKESIRPFLYHNKLEKIGFIFYKNQRFVFGNQVARELVNIDINRQVGHPLSKILHTIAQEVSRYKSPQSHLVKSDAGTTLVFSGMPHLEYNHVIITVCHPDIADIIGSQIDHLKDPSAWNYLLYLESTRTGKLINQHIPSSSEAMLNFKTDILQAVLTGEIITLGLPEEDLLPTVELLHNISLREKLRILTLDAPTKHFEMTSKLFGVNPNFNSNAQRCSLLSSLDKIGTLFICNVQFLDKETQKYLVEFIQEGSYRTFRGERKITSDVQIICSTNVNFQQLAIDRQLLPELYRELKKSLISMPKLINLDEKELYSLIDGFAQQVVKTGTFSNLLTLSSSDKLKLLKKRPSSLQELKRTIRNIIIQKAKKNSLDSETEFNPAHQTDHEPELIEAAQLGKHALKDEQIMATLWNKFENQNQIATFLGVNRSSVNRRCKEYNLT